MIFIKTLYIEKKDKPRFYIGKGKIEKDKYEIYANIEREKNIRKIINKLIKNNVSNVVLSKDLCEDKNLVNALKASNINIFDGRWLIKYISIEILDYIVQQSEIKKEQIEIAITSNEITDLTIEIIKIISKQYKRVTVVTNHIEKLKKIEEEIYQKEGILIITSNNKKKSLLKPKIILNLDFNKEVLNNYKINEEAIIINLEGGIKINDKRFNGICINDYEIQVGREEIIWRENMRKFNTKDLLEASLYIKDTFKNIHDKIKKNKIAITALYGLNGKIERFS